MRPLVLTDTKTKTCTNYIYALARVCYEFRHSKFTEKIVIVIHTICVYAAATFGTILCAKS